MNRPDWTGIVDRLRKDREYAYEYVCDHEIAKAVLQSERAMCDKLAEALEFIAKPRVGLDMGDSDEEWRGYWSKLALDYRSLATKTIATYNQHREAQG